MFLIIIKLFRRHKKYLKTTQRKKLPHQRERCTVNNFCIYPCSHLFHRCEKLCMIFQGLSYYFIFIYVNTCILNIYQNCVKLHILFYNLFFSFSNMLWTFFSGEYIQIYFYCLCASIIKIYRKLFNYSPTDGTLKEMISIKECYIFMPLSNDFIGNKFLKVG